MPRDRREHLEDQIRSLYEVTTQLQNALKDLARRLGPEAERVTEDRLEHVEATLRQYAIRTAYPPPTGPPQG